MKRIYACLSRHGFSSARKTSATAAKLRRDEIGRLFEDYESTVSDAIIEARRHSGYISIFSDSWAEPLPGSLIRQLGLYVDTIYVQDPILEYAIDWKNLDSNIKYVVPYKRRSERKKAFLRELAGIIRAVLEIKPLVDADIVRFVPSQLLGPRIGPTTLYATSFYGPKETGWNLLGDRDPIKQMRGPIRDYARDKMRVDPAALVDGTYKLISAKELRPCRLIAVGFPGDPMPKVFHLFETTKTDEDSRKLRMHLRLDGVEQPVDARTFHNWVEGSRNEVLFERVARLQNDLYLAAFSDAKFLTNLPTSRDLARLDLRAHDASSDKVIQALLRVRLPYFQDVSNDQLAKARRNEAAFEEFRAALDKAFSSVKGSSDTELQSRVDEVVRDLLLKPIAQIESRMKSLRRNLFLDGLMLSGTLAATILTQGHTLTTVAALLVANKTLGDYKAEKIVQDRIRESPGFLYWEVTRHARKRHPGG